jgi:hypothetical protein
VFAKIGNATPADVAELADAPDLGSGIARCEGSSPFIRIFRKKVKIACKQQVFCSLLDYLYQSYSKAQR